MIDISLLLTIGFIFLITLVGAYLRTRVKDRCLKAFEGYQVTLERTNNQTVWGKMHVEPTGLELHYESAVHDEEHVESSYVLYNAEYKDIQAIYRYADQLSTEESQRRDEDVFKSFHPGPLRRFGRSLRNFIGTATDSLNEVMNVVLGRVQKTGGRYITEGANTSLSKLGGQVVGQLGSIYDPLLEHFVGQRVVIELLEETEIHEHVGIFQDYSPDFFLVLDVRFPQPQSLDLGPNGRAESPRVQVSVDGGNVRIFNRSATPILVQSVTQGAQEQLVNALVDSGETVDVYPAMDLAGAKLHMRVVRELDLIVPRSRSVVRHSAEYFKVEGISDTLCDVIFDLGIVFDADRRRDLREARLRGELERNPSDALSAANLAGLLIQQGEKVEAEHWLRLALTMQESLPDGGRRARMQLREIERRRTAGSGQAPDLIKQVEAANNGSGG